MEKKRGRPEKPGYCQAIFNAGTGNAKLLWLLGGGAGNIIIWTVIIEGIKEEKPNWKTSRKAKALRIQSKPLIPSVSQPRRNQRKSCTRSWLGPLSRSQRITHLCLSSVPNKILTPAPFPILMCRPSMFVCLSWSMWCLYHLLLSGWDPRGAKPCWGLCAFLRLYNLCLVTLPVNLAGACVGLSCGSQCSWR